MTPIDKIIKNVPGKNGAGKILIIRSARMDLFQYLLGHARAYLPKAEIHVLAQKSFLNKISREKGVAGIISIPDGLFRLQDINRSLIDAIRDQKFDLVLLLLNNESGKGYIPFRLLLSLSKIPHKWEFNIARHFKRSGLRIPILLWEYQIDLLKKSIGFLFYTVLAAYWKKRLKVLNKKDSF